MSSAKSGRLAHSVAPGRGRCALKQQVPDTTRRRPNQPQFLGAASDPPALGVVSKCYPSVIGNRGGWSRECEPAHRVRKKTGGKGSWVQRLLRDHRNSQEVLAVPRQRAPQALALLDRNARLGLATHHSAQNPSGSRASGQAGGWPPSGVNCGSDASCSNSGQQQLNASN